MVAVNDRSGILYRYTEIFGDYRHLIAMLCKVYTAFYSLFVKLFPFAPTGEFLTSLPRIESAAGVALVIDRLVMVLAAAQSIDEVRVV